MNLSFLAPQFLWLLLTLPGVVLLHFLRTRRRQQVVSALFLWRRASELADTTRRFSATWLLLLQLLFVTLAALALAQPAVSFEGPPDRVLVVDASASMAAVDSDGARIDKARAVAESLLEAGGQAALLRAGLDTVVLAPLDADHSRLRAQLVALTPGDREADLTRALELAQSLAPEGEVHLITDSQVTPGQFTHHTVGGDAVNYGVTAFDTSLGQTYVAVSSNDPRPQQVDLALFSDGEELERTTLLVPANGQATATFTSPDGAGILEARLEPPPGDALGLDDVAFTGQQPIDVVVTADVPPLSRALDSVPGLDYRVTGALAASANVTVLFADTLPALPPGDLLIFTERAEDPAYLRIRDWAQEDELLRFVDLRNVLVGIPPGLLGEEQEGWEVLARAEDLTPVITRLEDGERTVIRAAFHPGQTDMVLRPAFPTFIANAMDSFRGESALPLGSLLPEGASYAGEEVDRALQPGIYLVDGGEVTASLLSVTQTRLPQRTQAPPGEATDSIDAAGGNQISRALWLLLIAVALVLLLIEWFGWSRGGAGWIRA